MNANPIHISRDSTILRPDQSRVLLRPFSPGDPQRVGRIIARIMSLPEDRVGPLLDEVSAVFSQRHQQIRKLFLERFEQVRELLLTDEEVSEQRRLLIGSYFLAEYSLESAALFNPSIVPHPDQTDLPSGALRFILSLRATGEGHISSITCRTGPSHRRVTPHQIATKGIRILARSNYEVQFEPEQQLSERIVFPVTPSQRNGIEDARFVCFRNDDGTHTYYATFTAYDGKVVVPELVETSDFLLFRFITLNGPAAENKGMAIFPRKINGLYAMLSRQDNENIYLMFSDNVHFWNERRLLLKPTFPWELVQLGNCGSPIETDAGWLVLSHGVGPMRKYCIGAFLLDRDDPAKVIGRLREPLLKPNPHEREGY